MEEPQHSSNQQYLPGDEYRPEPVVKPLLPAWMDGSVRIGIHTSIAGDIAGALDIASRLGANALQIFSASPRMWSRGRGGGRVGDEDARRFRARREELKLGPLVIHDNYLINLASPERVLRVRSIQAFHDEIVRALALDADFLVAHPGSSRGADMRAAIAAIADGLKQASRGVNFAGATEAGGLATAGKPTTAGRLRILLENTAGQGSSVGSRFAELQEIIEQCPQLPLGVCVDTAHLFAAGHDLRTAEGLDAALKVIDRTVGLARVFVVHVNDSKAALGLRLDRHEHIGKGKIGREAFRRILNHPLLAGRAFILETPIDKPGDDRRNIETLWKLAGMKAKGSKDAADGFRIRRHERAKRKLKTRAADKSKRKAR
ncbi:MAG TPA: deoxyribonuclease IV [Candidatus Acidoferrales bacterium]|nr:deoxyribonuclease IV [Candidatus Acidoferrales bacterium]